MKKQETFQKALIKNQPIYEQFHSYCQSSTSVVARELTWALSEETKPQLLQVEKFIARTHHQNI